MAYWPAVRKVPSAKRLTLPAPPPLPPFPPKPKETERFPAAEPLLVVEPIPPPPPTDWSNNAVALSPNVVTAALMTLELDPKLTLLADPPEPPVPPTPAEAPNVKLALESVEVVVLTSPARPPPPPKLWRVIPTEESPRVSTLIGFKPIRLTDPPEPPEPPEPPMAKDTDPETLLPPDAEASLRDAPPVPPPPPTDWRNKPSAEDPLVAMLPP